MNQQSKTLRANNAAKLTEDQVIKIRDLLIEEKLTFKEIGDIFGVSAQAIYSINSGKIWTHVEGIGTKIRTKAKRNTKLNETQIMEIRDLLIEGELTYNQIAEMFGVSYANIRIINDGKTWNHVEGVGGRLRAMKAKKLAFTDLSENQVMQVRDLLKEGKLTFKEISDIFGVGVLTIKRINDGEIWTQVEGIGSRIKAKKSNSAKLNEAQVMAIRDLLVEGKLAFKEIAEMFGVCYQTVCLINDGKIWTHVEGIGSKLRIYMANKKNVGNAKLNEDQVVKIRDLLIERKLTFKEIAEMFGVCTHTVALINNGKVWTHVEGIGAKIRTKK